MAPIPEEIWLQIFKLVQNARSRGTGWGRLSWDTLRRSMAYEMARAASVRPLTETCRAFHRICLPLLFDTIVMDGSPNGGARRARCLADVLHRKAHLMGMVSEVHIYWTYGDKDLWDRIEGVIAGLCSVRDMWIEGAYLSTRLLGRHPRLERLVLFEVFSNPTEGPTIHSFDSLKYLRCGLDSFEDGTAPFAALVMPQLETLQIGSDDIDLTGTGAYQVFQFNPAVLKTIIIEATTRWEDEGLVELLQRASRVKSLELELAARQLNPSFSLTLPDDAIPDLEAFDGPADVVLAFCKGRPVRDLYVSGRFTWSMTEEVPNLIRPGSVPLEHLHLDQLVWEDGTIEYIARHCPQLVSLKIVVDEGHRNGTLTTRYSMPRLRRAAFLSLNHWYSDDDDGSDHGRHWYSDDDDGSVTEKVDKLLQESREFWPQLEDLRLHPEYLWTYRDLEGGWVQAWDD